MLWKWVIGVTNIKCCPADISRRSEGKAEMAWLRVSPNLQWEGTGHGSSAFGRVHSSEAAKGPPFGA